MKIAIIGAGALGSLFSSLLNANNNEAVLYVKNREQADFIKKNGLTLIYPDTDKKIKTYPDTVSDISRIKNYDYYLLCVKSYSTEKAAEECASALGDSSVIVTFQNGMRNVEKIQKFIPETRIAAGISSEAATFLPPSSVIYGGKGKTAISMISRQCSNSILAPLLKALNSSSLETEISSDYRRDIWKKLIINAAINPLTAALSVQNRYVSESAYLRKLSEMIIKESVKAAETESIYFTAEEMEEIVFSIAEKTGKNRSSMLQDIDNKRKTEIDDISGALTDKADISGFSSPVNRIMLNIIKVLESRYFT